MAIYMVATLAGKAGKPGKAGKKGVLQKIAGKAGKGYHFPPILAGKAGILFLSSNHFSWLRTDLFLNSLFLFQ